MVAQIVWFGLICLIIPAIAHFAGTRKKIEKSFDWITMAGLIFILAGTFDMETVTFWITGGLNHIAIWLMQLCEVIGWIFVVSGILLAFYDYFR